MPSAHGGAQSREGVASGVGVQPAAICEAGVPPQSIPVSFEFLMPSELVGDWQLHVDPVGQSIGEPSVLGEGTTPTV
jgi:hypothetical protein